MGFLEAVRADPKISGALRQGLQALSANADKVKYRDPRCLRGSVDLDTCLRELYPDGNRWDYVFGYRDHVYYLEVHPASTGEVRVVCRKLQWLKSWQATSPLYELRSRSTYHWVASGSVRILPGSKYSKQLAQAGIKRPCRGLDVEADL